jgi:hypothetical protein
MITASLPIPLLLFAAVALILALLQAARIRDIEEGIRWRLHQVETKHRCKMVELEAELERTKQRKSSSLGALDHQTEQ